MKQIILRNTIINNNLNKKKKKKKKQKNKDKKNIRKFKKPDSYKNLKNQTIA